MATPNKVLIHTNAVTGNEVLTYNRANDGTLTFKERDFTAGKGGTIGAPDPLASQGSLVYDSAHDLVFVVNAGDSFLSVLRFFPGLIFPPFPFPQPPIAVAAASALSAAPSPAIQPSQVTNLSAQATLLRPAIFAPRLALQSMMTSNGAFPVSVAVHGSLVYVLNAQGAGSIQGYRIQSDSTVAPIPNSLRSLGLTSPMMFTQSPAHIRFSPDGSKLVISTKDNPTGGSRFLVYLMDHAGLPSANFVATASHSSIPFGFTFTNNGILVATEVGAGGVASYVLNANGSLTFKAMQASGGAACWTEFSGGHCYVTNFSDQTITAHTVDASGNFGAAGTPMPVGGSPFDLAISSDGKFLYVQVNNLHAVKVYPINANGTLGNSIQTVTDPAFATMQGIVAT